MEQKKGFFFARLRGYFLSGILVTAPLALTLYVAWTVITSLDQGIKDLIPKSLGLSTLFPRPIPGLGLVSAIIGFIIIGWLTQGFLGKALLKGGENIVHRMPLVRGFYKMLKQVFETVLQNNTTAFRKVVLFEYPRKGSYVIGFVSGKTKGEVQSHIKEDLLNVFVPTTPNPTSGFLLFIPESQVTYLDMGVEEGIKLVVSAGIVTPDTCSVPKKTL